MAGIDWMHLDQHKEKWQALVNRVMNLVKKDSTLWG
jgi:hypothetical protein